MLDQAAKSRIETAVRAGHRIPDVTKDTAEDTIDYLQDLAGVWIDTGQDAYAQIALCEAGRISKKFPREWPSL